MIVRLAKVSSAFRLLASTQPTSQFVIMKMIKRKFKKEEEKYEPKAHAYTYNPNQ